MKVHDSALKHGVLAEDAVQAADWPLWVEPLDEEDWPTANFGSASIPRLACSRRSSSSSRAATNWSFTRCQLAGSTGTSCPKERHPSPQTDRQSGYWSCRSMVSEPSTSSTCRKPTRS